MGDIKFKSTDKAKTQGADLQKQAEYYNSLVDQLQQIATTLSQTWLGDMADIQDILNQISEVAREFDGKLVPAMSLLGSGVESFAEQVEKVANKDDPSKVDGKSNKKNKSWWDKTKSDFKDDWNYKNCKDVSDYVGATASGIVKTAGDVVENGGGAAAGAVVGTALGGPIGTVIGAGAGHVVGKVAGAVGDAVGGLFDGIGKVF